MRKLVGAMMLVSAITVFSYKNSNGQAERNKVKEITAAERAMWKEKLTKTQYHIMVEKGTEYAFRNEYYDNHDKGVYVSAATGDVLFSSADKYDSGTGWPSFVKPVSMDKIAIVEDNSLGITRLEVVEKSTGLHLGHVFDDGPEDRGGKRYCLNSGALKFIRK
ncbi:peptide-methionine (R)-S-oxide reductase [Mucilaginibacter limnophilus]|uniref:peptide-methionine (R)-S-oxide reductase n=1 Tax=Mucilaginibacter limnophilus TaxID=1932778 RepID=A0A437MSJ6_9SPHI|nr:peptide-methionine (R)-S-oxide reductase MsrB [Mucilaginibacter limnophilus]RVU00622.1 peptide-methionine (R)-S-oxide reductase [Mucilaginibacter limnophilus]